LKCLVFNRELQTQKMLRQKARSVSEGVTIDQGLMVSHPKNLEIVKFLAKILRRRRMYIENTGEVFRSLNIVDAMNNHEFIGITSSSKPARSFFKGLPRSDLQGARFILFRVPGEEDVIFQRGEAYWYRIRGAVTR